MPAKKPQTRIKNYTADVSVNDSLTIIRQSLARHKARRITFEHDDEGYESAIQFMIEVERQPYTFRMPARVEQVKHLVDQAHREMGKPLRGEGLENQARRTAWANIRDWVLSQMALVDAQMVKLEEVFFPFALIPGGQTVFEAFEQHRALPGPGQFTIREVQ